MNQKIVVITGATGQLGQELVKFYLETDLVVAAIGKSQDKLDKLSKDSANQNLTVFQADLTDKESAQNVVDEIFSKFGRLDFLINATGGFSGGKTVFEMDASEWQKMINVNLNATFYISQYVMRIMKKQHQGNIINISAAASFAPAVKKLAYYVSKSALNALTQVLAVEGKEFNIRVNSIAPSIILTESNKKDMPNQDSSKWITPREIFEAIQYLTSEKAKSISGTVVRMSGDD